MTPNQLKLFEHSVAQKVGTLTAGFIGAKLVEVYGAYKNDDSNILEYIRIVCGHAECKIFVGFDVLSKEMDRVLYEIDRISAILFSLYHAPKPE